MFRNVFLGSNDIGRSKKFYDAIFVAIGGQPGEIDPLGRIVYSHNGNRLLITLPVDGNPATYGNGATLGLIMDSPEQADAWHKAGIENGGVTAENPPGIREYHNGKIYLAYLRDPDGNKLCGSYRYPD